MGVGAKPSFDAVDWPTCTFELSESDAKKSDISNSSSSGAKCSFDEMDKDTSTSTSISNSSKSNMRLLNKMNISVLQDGSPTNWSLYSQLSPQDAWHLSQTCKGFRTVVKEYFKFLADTWEISYQNADEMMKKLKERYLFIKSITYDGMDLEDGWESDADENIQKLFISHVKPSTLLQWHSCYNPKKDRDYLVFAN